jgi:hypothetical protein
MRPRLREEHEGGREESSSRAAECNPLPASLDGAITAEDEPMVQPVVRFSLNSDQVSTLISWFRALPLEEDGVVEASIVKEPYDASIITLFRERKKLGIRLDDCPDESALQWARRNGFEESEGESYVDPETYEERTVAGPPIRFPVNESDMTRLLPLFLQECHLLPAADVLIAAADSNPDDWPEIISTVGQH